MQPECAFLVLHLSFCLVRLCAPLARQPAGASRAGTLPAQGVGTPHMIETTTRLHARAYGNMHGICRMSRDGDGENRQRNDLIDEIVSLFGKMPTEEMASAVSMIREIRNQRSVSSASASGLQPEGLQSRSPQGFPEAPS